jgi:alcohol dehydrogenase
MKAIFVKKAGGPEVLECREVEQPTPGDQELLVRVRAATVTRGDVALRSMPRAILVPVGLLFGFKPMEIPGVEFAGEVVAVGGKVGRYQVGDLVFGTTTGLARGANAEYVCVPETSRLGVLAKKPEGLSFAEAAALPVGAMTARFLLVRAGLKSGDRVLVHGASGSVGACAVQLAVLAGAEVTGVCSAGNTALVRSLGASRVIDYATEDVTAGPGGFDLVFDAAGKLSRRRCRAIMAPGGRYTGVRSPTSERLEDLAFVTDLAAAGKFKVLIDRSFPLTEVAEAHRYVEAGHKRGNVGILLD